jgi:transposase
MVLVDGKGTPLGVHLDSASPAEVKLLSSTLDNVSVRGRRGRPRKRPERIVADRAYDSNNLRKEMKKRGIQLIVPARKRNKIATEQDGRVLRRYKNRWIVERTISWLQNFRRLVVRYERKVSSFSGFLHLACAMLLLKRVLK